MDLPDDITTLLESWKMPNDIIEAFGRNGIGIDQLDQLSPDHIKEICPQIGTRIKLTNKINEYLESKAPTATASTLGGDSMSTGTICGDSTSAGIIFPEESGNLTITLSDLFPTVATHQSFPDFDLKTLLETSPCGKSIINYYISHGQLDTKRKNRLTDIIIRHLFTFIINKRLSYDDYNILTGKIITLFPKETAGTYFTRPIRKQVSATGKSIPARGKLIDKVRNFVFQNQDLKRVNNTEKESSKKLKKNEEF